MKGQLTIVVGLPGSGKSSLLKTLKKRANGLYADDFMKRVVPGSPIDREPSITDSFHYSTLIRDLRLGRHCVISDIILCDALMRTSLEMAVKTDAPGARIKWEFFENNPKQCEQNARRRGRKGTLAREIKLISYLSRKYFIPEKIKARRVWKSSKD